jgi:hypothetical protein
MSARYFEEEIDDEGGLPPEGLIVLVQCQDFRCLAYRKEGKWKSAFGNEELETVIRIYPIYG